MAWVRRAAVVAAWVMCPFIATADDRGRVALDIDALVHVSGMPMAGTEVYIVPAEGRVEHITEGFSQFARELHLQTTYLLSFERDGCLSKQVYIDTHVPQSYMSLSPFDFRFKVTLEERERAGDRYAGPVAFVRFQAGRSDFEYETDYTLLRDSLVFERLELARSLGVDHPRLRPAASSVKVYGPVAPGERGAGTTLGPDPGRGEVMERQVTRVGPEGPVDHQEFSVARVLGSERSHDAEGGTEEGPVITDRKEVDIHAPFLGDLTSLEHLSTGRAEELIVERSRVTTIVRVVLNGVEAEYRRVAHYYGGVTYFKNGAPCSEDTYRAGTGRMD